MSSLVSHILFKKYKKVRTICEPLIKLNIIGFIYMRRYQDGRFIDLANQIDWSHFFLNRYLSEEYPSGIAENHMLSDRGALFWSLEPENLIWKEGAEVFSFGNGISIFVKKDNFCEIFSFYGKKDDFFLNKFYASSFSTLEKFALYFKENMEADILEACKKQDFLITPKKYLDSKSSILLNSNEENFLQEIKLMDKKELLSKREQECIMLCASGKTAKEAARVLEISPRTVEVHITNAKEKLGCKNFRELCCIFSTNRFFNF